MRNKPSTAPLRLVADVRDYHLLLIDGAGELIEGIEIEAALARDVLSLFRTQRPPAERSALQPVWGVPRMQ
jgi:hypothetical protein